MALIRSHNLSIGIVGLPNSGKSTIFNALTKSAIPAENYPFCTIDKNIGVVKLSDPRLDRLAALLNPQKIVPSALTFVDIAGLVEGASKGEGLGNQFLGHIREVSACMYVIRAFQSEAITHVYDRVSPADDLKIVRSELILKDIETVERKLHDVMSRSKAGATGDIAAHTNMLEKVLAGLNDEIPAISVELSEEEREVLGDLWLLTDKPPLYVLNIKGGADEEQVSTWKEEVKSCIDVKDAEFIVPVDCKMEVELDGLSKEERAELQAMVSQYQGVENLIEIARKRLNLVTFYTGNEKEANAWTIQKGATIKEAAGVIHTSLESGFVAAEIIAFEDLISSGGWLQARVAGVMKNVGKDYIVADGDCVNILAHKE